MDELKPQISITIDNMPLNKGKTNNLPMETWLSMILIATRVLNNKSIQKKSAADNLTKLKSVRDHQSYVKDRRRDEPARKKVSNMWDKNHKII